MSRMQEGASPVPIFESPAPRPGSAGLRTTEFAYRGIGSDYFVLQLVNWALSLVTFGFFHPWARVRELRYVIGSLQAGGDAFTFHGNGGELFLGFLRAWLLFLVPLFGLFFLSGLPGLDAGLQLMLSAAAYVLLGAFVLFAILGSMRYRASRTTWRGIRFGFDGRYAEFSRGYVVRMLAVFFTLGLVYPWAATWRREFMVSHARLGGEPMRFDGTAGDLFPKYLLCWFLLFPTLGLSMVWFHGHQQAYYWNQTMFAGGRFRSSLTGSQWLGISILNGLLVLLTLGFGAPFAYTNVHREFFERLTLEGGDLERIRAAQSAGSGLGEGSADLLDMDGGVDIG